jgi:hypothetical protein
MKTLNKITILVIMAECLLMLACFPANYLWPERPWWAMQAIGLLISLLPLYVVERRKSEFEKLYSVIDSGRYNLSNKNLFGRNLKAMCIQVRLDTMVQQMLNYDGWYLPAIMNIIVVQICLGLLYYLGNLYHNNILNDGWPSHLIWVAATTSAVFISSQLTDSQPMERHNTAKYAAINLIAETRPSDEFCVPAPSRQQVAELRCGWIQIVSSVLGKNDAHSVDFRNEIAELKKIFTK